MGQLDYDYIFKVVVIGDKDVGKTSLLKRFAANTFSNTSIGTIGVDFLVKDFDIGLSKVKVSRPNSSISLSFRIAKWAVRL